MNILIISESINIEDSSASKVNVALIQNLKKAGHHLKVFHFSHKIIQLEGVDCVLIPENRFSILFFLSRFVRVFQRFTGIYINYTVEKWFGFSFTHTNDTKRIARFIKNVDASNFNLILTLSKGGSFRPHRAMLKLPKLHYKWMAYIHDPYPFHMYPRPYNWIEYGYVFKEKMMRSIFENANRIAFPSLLLKQWMQSYFPCIEDKSVVIPHQINTEIPFANLPEYFISNQFSLLHAGNLLKQRNPKYLLEAYMLFLEKHPEAKSESKLYIIGNNEFHKELLSQYENHSNILIKSYTEYNIIANLEKNVTVNIILEAVSEISPFLPGKFPNCVIADKPILILGPYYSEVKRLLGNDYPYWSEANDSHAIEKVISKLYEQWKLNPLSLKLNRNDLFEYTTENYLNKILIQSI
jgi:hypothetical protein